MSVSLVPVFVILVIFQRNLVKEIGTTSLKGYLKDFIKNGNIQLLKIKLDKSNRIELKKIILLIL